MCVVFPIKKLRGMQLWVQVLDPRDKADSNLSIYPPSQCSSHCAHSLESKDGVEDARHLPAHLPDTRQLSRATTAGSSA